MSKKTKVIELMLPEERREADMIYDANCLNYLRDHCYDEAKKAGWYTDLKTGKKKDRNVGEMLMLAVSELAEGMEAHRKNLMDDKLPHRKGVEVEIVDNFIRLFDLAGYLKLDLTGAFIEKLQYNASRPDHKISNRKKANGKKY